MAKQPTLPFIGRAAERDAVLTALQGTVSADAQPQSTLHFHGVRGIGKTALIRQLPSWCRDFERSACIGLDLSDPYSLDPFRTLLRLRGAFRRTIPDFESHAFDYAAVIFDRKFRDGLSTSHFIQNGEFSAEALLEVSLADALIKAADATWQEFRSAGIVVSSSAAGFLTAKLLAAALTPIVTGAVIAGSASAMVIGLKHLIRGVRHQARKRNLLERYPLLNWLVEVANYEEYVAELGTLLGAAVHEALRGGVDLPMCISIDPADGFSSNIPEHGAKYVGRVVSRVGQEISPLLLIVTSRLAPIKYVSPAIAEGVLPSHPVRSHELKGLTALEVHGALALIGFPVSDQALQSFCPDGVSISPEKLVAWWDELGIGHPRSNEHSGVASAS